MILFSFMHRHIWAHFPPVCREKKCEKSTSRPKVSEQGDAGAAAAPPAPCALLAEVALGTHMVFGAPVQDARAGCAYSPLYGP